MAMAWVIIFTIKSWEVRSSSHRNWRESERVGEALAIRAEGELAWPVDDVGRAKEVLVMTFTPVSTWQGRRDRECSQRA